MIRNILLGFVVAVIAVVLMALAREQGRLAVVHAEGRPQEPRVVLQGPVARLLFAGDMQYDRHIRDVIETHGDGRVFDCMDPVLQKFDAVVANLEGPITSETSRSRGSVVGSPANYQFTFPTSTPGILLKHNIRIVTIGNNHISNFGTRGFRSTQDALSAAGIGFFGGLQGDDRIYRTTVRDVELSFVGYNEFGGDSAEDTAQKIALEKSIGRTVIVFAHWGDEYQAAASRQKVLAVIFAGAGADAVVGAHPHVVQERQMLGEVPVFYSLGNFIFDQYWNDDVSHGLAVELDATKSGVSVGSTYTTSSAFNGKTCLESES